ncbi:MAG: phosphotransferase [Janibacter sp.]
MRFTDTHAPIVAHDAHALLAAQDAALPALGDLLDATPLAERLGAPVSRSYVRYKHGTSATALLDIGGRPAVAHAWRPGAGDKRAKALKYAAPEDVLLDLPAAGLLVLDALSDRHLPALRLLVRSGRVGPWLSGIGQPVASDARPETLAHKPARRWVGRLALERPGEHVVLRAYAGRGYDAALAANSLIDPEQRTAVRLPRVLGTHRRGLIALEHLRGRPLDESVPEATLRCLGATLGALHAHGPMGVIGAEHPAVTDGIDVLEPVLGGAPAHAREIEAEARAALRPGPASIVHGDFSLDQVVADGHDLGIIDLDRARRGHPLDDLASLLAAAALTALSSGGARAGDAMIRRLRAPFVAGHAATWTGGELPDDLGPRTALELLRRSGEPFRGGRGDWPEVTRDLVTLAGALTRGEDPG